MTDPVTSRTAHPSPDQLADLRAGALPSAEARWVTAHVAGCDRCADELAAMDQVEALLAEAGDVALTMPDDVAARVDEAIAAAVAHRDAGVPELDARRAAATDAGAAARRRRRAVWGGLVAAAAVIVAVGATGGVLDSLRSSSGDADSASAGGDTSSRAAQDRAESGGSAADEPQKVPSPPAVDRAGVAGLASQVEREAARNRAVPRQTALFGAAACPPLDPATRWQRAVAFEGQPAYITVKPATREVVVHSCETPPSRLYATTY